MGIQLALGSGVKGGAMKQEQLNKYIGKLVHVQFYDGIVACGELEFIPSYSAKYGFKHPGFFYIGDISFKSTDIKKMKMIEEASDV